MGHRNPKINRYYMIAPEDGFLDRWRKRLTRRPVPRFPRNIQIQTQTGCNADCVFCPYGATADTQPKVEPQFRVLIKDAEGDVVAEIDKLLSVKTKLPQVCRAGAPAAVGCSPRYAWRRA